jgi:hypothetical protein
MPALSGDLPMNIARMLTLGLLFSASAQAHETYVCLGQERVAGKYDIEVFASASPEWPSIRYLPYAVRSDEPVTEEQAYPPARSRVSRTSNILAVKGLSSRAFFPGAEVSLEVWLDSSVEWNADSKMLASLGADAPAVLSAHLGTLTIADDSAYEGEINVVCGLLESKD